MEKFVHESKLEHAPEEQEGKALEFGDWAEVLDSASGVMKKGTKVLISVVYSESSSYEFLVYDKNGLEERYSSEHLKPL